MPFRTLTLLGALLLGAAPAHAGARLDDALYARLLDTYTRQVSDTAGTRVDYPGLAGSAEWKQLVENLASTDPQDLVTRDERLAYWMNAYNILAIDVVVKNYPLKSIRDVGSLWKPVWDREAGRIAGKPYTLGQIEHEILRPMGDPRIHVAIVCASTSCPSLRREPFVAERVDQQLDDNARRFLTSTSKGLRIDRESRTVTISKIFRWFEEDFESEGGVLAFVERHAPESERDWLARAGEPRVRYFDYDWSVNVVRS